ncbi:MAG: mercuric transport protein MerTP, partial [Bacteroidota bacterium]
GLTVAVLGFAWQQKLKPQKAEIACDCEADGKTPFLQTKICLGIVTAFAVLMLAFPHYSKIFYPDNIQAFTIGREADVQTATFDISGMTCTSCEEHVKHAVNKLPGIVELTASHEKGDAVVKFDRTKSSVEEIKAAIDETGYKVTDYSTAGIH